MLRAIFYCLLLLGCAQGLSAAPPDQNQIFKGQIQPLLKKYCLECHGPDTQEGDLAFHSYKDVAAVAADPKTWQRAIQMLRAGAMPPEDVNRDAADGLAKLIAAFGYPVKAVYDGEQAIAEAASFAPDMALIDIGMPGLDGYETVMQIRKLRAAAQVILVAVTGRSGDEDKQRAYECGFDLYEAKPLSVERLKQLLILLDPEGAGDVE